MYVRLKRKAEDTHGEKDGLTLVTFRMCINGKYLDCEGYYNETGYASFNSFLKDFFYEYRRIVSREAEKLNLLGDR